MSLSGDVSPHVSPFLPAFWTILTLFVFKLAVVAVLLFRGGSFPCAHWSSRGRRERPPQAGRTGEENATLTREPQMEEKVLQQLSQEMQTLQKAFQNMQESTQRDLQMIRKDLENKQGMTEGILEPMWKKDLQQLSQEIQTLQENFQNMHESTQRDLQMIRKDLKNKQGRTGEGNTTTIMESMWKKDFQQISHQLQNLQQFLQNMQVSTQHDLQLLRTDLENKQVLSKVQSYKGSVTLDADTAHPRLEISLDGRSVRDTGVIRQVPINEKRFDSHLFVLAKEGYTSGRHYWEVHVGRRRSWALGIALESVTRKGPLALSPENGFWAIRLADGRDYWAYMDCWTHLSVSGKLHKIGIFLSIPTKKLRFYDVRTGAALYTFSIADGYSQGRKFIPFFSTGPATENPPPEPLLIVQEFDDDDDE